jgi:membrane fusion protein, multidrug efflux system
MRFHILSAVVTACLLMLTAGKAQNSAPEWREGVAKPFRAVILSASLREVITNITVVEGDRIKEGQVIVNLQSAKEKVAVERLQLMQEKAEFDYNAARRLFEQNVSSKDEALAKELELKRIKADLKIAEADLAEREIRAPLSGVVVHRLHEVGEAVNEAEAIMQVMEVDRLLLLFHLEATMLSVLKIGQEIEVNFPELSPPLQGRAKVHFIDPEVDARSGLFRVRLLLDNQDGQARPGMKVRAKFPAQ